MTLPPGSAPLSLALGLRPRLDAVGHVRVDAPLRGAMDAGFDGLHMLELFSRPTKVTAALTALRPLGPVRSTLP